MNDVMKEKRRTYTKTFVHRIEAILNTAREMARGTADACERMDFAKLLDYSEDLSSAADAAVEETQNFIESEFAHLRDDRDNIKDEEEYFQQKYKSLEFVATELKKAIKKSLQQSKKCNNENGVMTEQSLVLNNSQNEVYNSDSRGLNSRHERTRKGSVNFESPV